MDAEIIVVTIDPLENLPPNVMPTHTATRLNGLTPEEVLDLNNRIQLVLLEFEVKLHEERGRPYNQ